MADNDRYSNDDNRDRLGQRDVYMDNRTGMGAQQKGYRAEWGRGREDRYGDRDENYNQGRGEPASFRDRDYGQQDGGRTGYRNRDDDSRYGGNHNYTQGNRYGTSNPSYSRSASQSAGQYGRDEAWQSYPSRSNADPFSGQSASGYRGQGRSENRYGMDAGVGGRSQSYEADYDRHGHRPGSAHDDQDRGWWDKAADRVAAWFGGDESQGAQGERQSHRGKGPKNYRRSDARVTEDVSDRLSDDHWLDASDIEVAAKDGEVTLTGMVKTRDDKRRAEQLAEQVSGVDNVQNNIRVQKADGWQAGDKTTAGGTTIPRTTSEFGSTSDGSTTSNLGDLGTTNTVRGGKTTQ